MEAFLLYLKKFFEFSDFNDLTNFKVRIIRWLFMKESLSKSTTKNDNEIKFNRQIGAYVESCKLSTNNRIDIDTLIDCKIYSVL